MKLVRAIVSALFIVSFAYVAHVCEHYENNILSADIGASNSRHVWLPTKLPTELESVVTLSQAIVSCESLRPLCTENVMKALPLSCTARCVSLGLPCPCDKNEPAIESLKDLQDALCHRYGHDCRIILSNDATNWMKGALAFETHMQNKTDRRPALMVVLGSAVGLAYFDGDEVKPLELADFSIAYNATRKLLKLEETVAIGKFPQYLMVGRYFWEQMKPNPLYDAITQFKNAGSDTQQYRALVNAVIEDILQTISESSPSKRIIIAGGNARYIDSEDMHVERDVTVINDGLLRGMSPGFIPMLSVYFEKEADILL